MSEVSLSCVDETAVGKLLGALASSEEGARGAASMNVAKAVSTLRSASDISCTEIRSRVAFAESSPSLIHVLFVGYHTTILLEKKEEGVLPRALMIFSSSVIRATRALM